MKTYAQKELTLTYLEQGLQSKLTLSRRSTIFTEWLKLVSKRHEVSHFMTEVHVVKLREVLNGWKQYVGHRKQQRFQMQLTLDQFSNKSPLLLNQVTKTFLLWHQQSNPKTSPRICHTILAKYVFEKWVACLSRLKHRTTQLNLANNHRGIVLKSKGLAALKQRVRSRLIQQNCNRIYLKNLVNKCFTELLNYTDYRLEKR